MASVSPQSHSQMTDSERCSVQIFFIHIRSPTELRQHVTTYMHYLLQVTNKSGERPLFSLSSVLFPLQQHPTNGRNTL